MLFQFDWKAFSGGVVTLVAAIVTLLNVGAVKIYLEQRWLIFSKKADIRERQIIFAQEKFEAELQKRDAKIIKLEALLEQAISDIRLLQASSAEGNARATIYAEQAKSLQTQLELLQDTVRACSEENDRLNKVISGLRS